MSCSDWEERIALYAGGDLSAAQVSDVERHVSECAGCQVLLSGLRESLELLREAHEEPLDAAHFVAVRARVLSELERGRRPWWWYAWVYAMVAAAMVVLIAVRPKRLAAPEPAAATKTMATAPASVATSLATAETSAGATPTPPPRRGRRRPKPSVEVIARSAEKPAESIVVKLITDDPDVIIYWITDTKGE